MLRVIEYFAKSLKVEMALFDKQHTSSYWRSISSYHFWDTARHWWKSRFFMHSTPPWLLVLTQYTNVAESRTERRPDNCKTA